MVERTDGLGRDPKPSHEEPREKTFVVPITWSSCFQVSQRRYANATLQEVMSPLTYARIFYHLCPYLLSLMPSVFVVERRTNRQPKRSITLKTKIDDEVGVAVVRSGPGAELTCVSVHERMEDADA